MTDASDLDPALVVSVRHRSMRSFRTAVSAALLLLSLAACIDGNGERERIVTDAQDIAFCCDPDGTLPMKVGEFRIQIYDGQLGFLDPSTISATFTSSFTRTDLPAGPSHIPPPSVRLSLASGDPLVLASNKIDVFVDNCDFSRIDVEVLAEVLGRRVDDQSLQVLSLRHTFSVVNTCPPTGPIKSAPQLMVEAILGTDVADFDQFSQDTPTGVPTDNPNSTIDPQVPIYDYTETFQVGSVVADLDQAQLDAAFLGANPTYPVGLSASGLTLRAVSSSTMMPGRYLLTWQCVVGDIPLNSPDQVLQYAFVADRDEDPANNYQPQAPLDKDPFDDTDTWYTTQVPQPGRMDLLGGERADDAAPGDRERCARDLPGPGPIVRHPARRDRRPAADPRALLDLRPQRRHGAERQPVVGRRDAAGR